MGERVEIGAWFVSNGALAMVVHQLPVAWLESDEWTVGLIDIPDGEATVHYRVAISQYPQIHGYLCELGEELGTVKYTYIRNHAAVLYILRRAITALLNLCRERGYELVLRRGESCRSES